MNLQSRDELTLGLGTLRKTLLSLQSFLTRTLPALQSQDPVLYVSLVAQGNALADKIKSTQRLFINTLGHVESDITASGLLSVKVANEIDVCRGKLTSIKIGYEDFVLRTKASLSISNPSLSNMVKLGVEAVKETVLETATRVGKIVEETGKNTWGLTALIPYIPYIAVGFGALYVYSILPKRRII